MKNSVAVVLVFVLAVTGCYGPVKVRHVDTAKVPHPEKEQIVGVTTLKGEDVVFDSRSGYVKDKVVHAQVKTVPWQIPLNEVQTIWVERRGLNKVGTIGLVAGVVVVGIVVTVAIIAAVKGGVNP